MSAMAPTYPTITAALTARRWARTFRAKRGHWPSVEERVTWIVNMFDGKKVDVRYINRAVEDQSQEWPT